MLFRSNNRKVVALQGFPGIGSVGKILVDYLIKVYKPKKVKQIVTDYLPNIVFVREKNLIEPAQISIYKKSLDDFDLILLSGNVQPTEDYSAYSVARMIVKELTKLNVDELIAFGGIGLPVEPENPRLFIAGTKEDLIKKLKKKYKLNDSFGTVTHISGLAGLVPMFSEQKGISSLIIITETFANPFYIGVPGARSFLQFLNKYLKLKLSLSSFDREFKTIKPKKEKKTSPQALNEVSDLTYIG